MSRRTRGAIGLLNVVAVGVIIYVHALVGLGSEWAAVGAFHSLIGIGMLMAAIDQ